MNFYLRSAVAMLPSPHSLALSQLSRIRFFATPWLVAHQAPLSMGFFPGKKMEWVPFPSLGDLPDPGIKPVSTVSSALVGDSLPLSHQGSPLSHSLWFSSLLFPFIHTLDANVS